MRVKTRDILEMRNKKAYLVLEGESATGTEGTLQLVEIDENNEQIGEPFWYELTFSSPIMDVIR